MDRTTLMNQYSTVEEFIAKIVDDVYEVWTHHFIAKAQANHLKVAKENLCENELIVLLDFAENYSFVVQDAVQDFIGKLHKQHYTYLLHISDLPMGAWNTQVFMLYLTVWNVIKLQCIVF